MWARVQNMEDQKLQKILQDWADWVHPVGKIVPRELAGQCILTPEVVAVIQGVRRSGKTTLLHQLMNKAKVSVQQAVFANFEDPRFVGSLDSSLLDQILQVATIQAKPKIFFFDEIQNVANWQKWLNVQLASRRGHTYVVTGSNSQLLGGELATALTGRHIQHELFPFDFDEFQSLTGSKSMEEFIRQGGFPAVLNFPQPNQLLQQYFLDIVDKDIRERLSARSSRTIQSVFKMVLESVGSELSLRRIAGAAQISPETASQYLQAGEDAYLIFSCPFFAYSEAKRIRNNRKFYTIDTGLRRALSTTTGDDLGKDFENLVFLTLRRKVKNIYYWKGKGEVDFVIESQHGVTPVQVTFGEPKPRHEEALQAFYEQYPYASESIYVTPESYQEFVEWVGGL